MCFSIGNYQVRRFRPGDLTDLWAILRDPAVMRHIEPPYSLERASEFLQVNGLYSPCRIYALTDENDRVIGQIIFHPYDDDAWEIGWILRRDFWGRGLASAVTAALVERCRRTGVKRCVIECDPAQSVTRHIAEKCVFIRREDRDGLAFYERILRGGEQNAHSGN